MIQSVISSLAHKSVGHIKEVMQKNHIQSVPILNKEQEVVGIVTSSDLIGDLEDGTPISKVMNTKVYTIPLYSDTHIAARIMRNHHIHHLIVTHEKKVVGILSAFDLLALVENHRFVMKNAPTSSKKKARRI